MKASIQVVLCRRCMESPKVLDLDRLQRLASELDNVVSAMIVDAPCERKSLTQIVAEARARGVDRAVVLACSRKELIPTLARAYKRAGVDEHLLEVVNIKEEVVLPHISEGPNAQAKTEAKLRAAVARAALLTPLEKRTEEMRTKNVVIIGAGVAGQAAAHAASREGAHTILLEKSGKTVKAPGIVMPHAQLVRADGYGGNFKLTIRAGDRLEELEAAAIVIATGGGWSSLRGPLAKAVKGWMPLYKFRESLQSGSPVKGPVVFVDTPDPTGKTLRVQDCLWDETLETAIELKKKHQDLEVFVLFQEMRAFGLSELVYKEAAELGVRFVRYDRSSPPQVDPKDPPILHVRDLSQGEMVALRLGTLVFAAVPPNEDNKAVAEALRIPLSADGAIRRGSIQRWPVSTPRPGIFVCGSALFPKPAAVARAEGEAAGAMAGEYVRRGKISYGGVVAEVAPEKCSACLTCVRTCPFEAPFIGDAGKAEIRPQACQGCGICVGICPSKAIELLNFTDEQIMTEVRMLLGGDF